MEFFSNHKKIFFAIIVVICVSIAAISIVYKGNDNLVENYVGYVISPMQKASTNIGKFFKGKMEALTNFASIDKENKYLKEKISELTAENNTLKLKEKENVELNKLLSMDQKYADYHKVGAHVIARDANNWYSEFLIDKGSDDGLQQNMVVMGSGGLVGRLVSVNKNYSRVVPLLDDSSAVSAKSTRTDDIGFVKGGDTYLAQNGSCKMEYIDPDAQIMVGDEITTSSLSQIYPPGIIIGTVKEVDIDPNGLTKFAIVKTAADFEHIETVLVIDEIYQNLNIN